MWLTNAIRNLWRKRRAETELDEEVREYVEMLAQEKIRSGVNAQQAYREAKMELGGVEQVKEQTRAVRAGHFLETLWQDLRYGTRMLRRSPGFTIVAVLTLALGIGANTAIFSVIENVMFRPLPFSAADQIVRMYATKDGSVIQGYSFSHGPSWMDLRDYAQSSRSFQQITAYDVWRKNVNFGDNEAEPEQMLVGLISPSYFEVLAIKPMLGRLFTSEENEKGRNYVAAISAQLWKNQFGGDSAVLGRTIRINDEPYKIVAVMPDVIPEWVESRTIQIWTPDVLSPDTFTEAARDDRGWGVLARMKSGVSLERAQTELTTIAARLAATHPVDRGIGVLIETLSETRVHDLRSMLFLLMGAVSLILLIACVNLANLLLARNSVRERELAMRAALGAGRGRLVAQLLAETLLLSLIGGGVGLLLAKIGVASLTRMHPQDLPQLSSLGVDWRVLMFTLIVSVFTSLLFGLGPALTASRLNLVESLKLGSRSGTAGSNAQRMRNVLVVVEMAMSLMLLVGASLLVQSIMRLERQQLGIRPDHLMTGHFYLPPIHYANPGAITRFSDQFADRIRALPGVKDASVTTIYPPYNGWPQMFEIPGHPATRIQDVPTAGFGVTDAHFLRTLGVPLIRGRDFSASDTATTQSVALISQGLERRYFPAEDPIGQRIHIGPPPFLQIPPGGNTTDNADVTIIGVIGDFKNAGLALPPQPQIIVLYSQHPLVNYGFKDIVIRTAANPHLMVPEITRQLHAMDADLPFAQTRTIDEIIDQQTGSQRFTTILLGLFALAGLVLAAIGIYGVVSFLVAQRRREMAIRIAVGASVSNVLWLVLKQGLNMAVIGASIGLVGAWAAQKLISGLLFGISAVDPLTFAGSALFLLAVVMIACCVPAWRAARVDPCTALRAE